MNACEARGGYEKRGGGGGGGDAVRFRPIQKRGGVLSVLGPIRKAGGGGGGGAVCFRSDTKSGGGGAACRTMIYILVCARVRDSAWGMERGGGGGGGNWSQRAAFRMNGGGGGGAAPPPPPSLCWIRGCWQCSRESGSGLTSWPDSRDHV